MPAPPDFGWQQGMAQLGSYRVGQGFGFVYVPTGGDDPRPGGTPPVGSLWAWILAGGPFALVTMVQDYEPSAVNAYPVRGAVRAGEGCAFPSVEAAALIAAGVAVAA